MSMKSILLEPYFYIEKLGFAGVYIFLKIGSQMNILWEKIILIRDFAIVKVSKGGNCFPRKKKNNKN